MEDSGKIQAVCAPAANPCQWLTGYFRTRAHLASHESDFHCDPACTRPGCTQQNLQVPVSLVDVMGAALHRGASVSTHYQRHYSLGQFADARHDWIRKVSLRLKKPCPFLEKNLCSIYPARPLACILFPEYLVQEGRFEIEARKEHFRDFFCMQNPMGLSPLRAAVMAQLKNMWEREACISSFHLFNHSQCYIDFSNLTEDLLELDRTLRDAESRDRVEPEGTIPNRVMQHFFEEYIAVDPIFAEVSQKITRLDSQEGQMQFLQLLQNDKLYKKLMRGGDDRALIFRLVKGKLQGRRRSLISSEHQCY